MLMCNQTSAWFSRIGSVLFLCVAGEHELQDVESDHDSYLSTQRDRGMWVDACGVVLCLNVSYLRSCIWMTNSHVMYKYQDSRICLCGMCCRSCILCVQCTIKQQCLYHVFFYMMLVEDKHELQDIQVPVEKLSVESHSQFYIEP